MFTMMKHDILTLQAAPGGAVEGFDLTDHGQQVRAAQALLHGPEHLGRAAGAYQKQAPGIEAGGG